MKKRMVILMVLGIFSFISAYANYKIAVLPKAAVGEYWGAVGKGAKKAGAELGASVTFRGPAVEDNSDAQLNMMRLFIRQKFDAVVLAPSNREKMLQGVKEAVAAGLKVIIIDSGIDGDYHESFIATDNYAAGRKAGEEMVKIIGTSGKIGIIRTRKGNSSTDLREKGFADVITENGLEIATDPYAGGVYGQIVRITGDVVSKNRDIKGYFVPYELGTIGLVKSLEKFGVAGKTAVIGFDFSDGIQAGIDNGTINGAIVQQPEMMGYLGVKAAVDVLNGKTVEKNIVVDVRYHTK